MHVSIYTKSKQHVFGHQNGAYLPTLCPLQKHPHVDLLERALYNAQ